MEQQASKQPLCRRCWNQHGKALLKGACVCTGHVRLHFTPPTGKLDAQKPTCPPPANLSQ